MRILLKCPTRSRPKQVIETLRKYIDLANKPDLIGICVSCDTDDATMHDPNVDYHITNLPVEWVKIFYSDNSSKIEAVNADMDKIEWAWDIVILVSDDMIPKVKGYDDIIRSNMTPDLDRIVWVNDGVQGYFLNTLSIMGRKMYDSIGYIYHPSYKSLFCDNEFTDLCKGSLASKCSYIETVLIRHEHFRTGFPEKNDALYQKNQRYWSADFKNYISRKTYEYDWSIMIPTLVERMVTFDRLMESIKEKHSRICPDLKIEYCIARDNREKSIGNKRQALLQGAKGKYVSFVDDDDSLTDAYFEDALECIRGRFEVCRLRGQMAQYTFTHSIENTLTSPMARGEVFLRPPNHLNIMLGEVAKIVPFGDAVRGEDLDWTISLAKLGFFNKEYRSDESRIHYIYQLGTRTVHPSTLEMQKTTNYATMLKMVWTPHGAVLPPGPKTKELRLTGKGFVSK
jgi:hypothetical protein